MGSTAAFRNYDDPAVFHEVRKSLLDPNTQNFVVEFGQKEAQVALNLNEASFKQLLEENNPRRDKAHRPVRWINLWAPNRQTPVVEVLARHYELSERFQAILKTKPNIAKQPAISKRPFRETRKRGAKTSYDVERGMTGLSPQAPASPDDINFYSIAGSLINYQSYDLNAKFTCIGNNWMHHPTLPPNEEGKREILTQRLWSWLFLCDDYTVISIHEDPMIDQSLAIDGTYMQGLRGHSISVLSQLSEQGIGLVASVTLISARSLLKQSEAQADPGFEGSSNLFYYLFDFWHETYALIIRVQAQLEALSREILSDVDSKHRRESNKGIIRDLYKIGKQLRNDQRLYESYKNTIERVLELKAPLGPISSSNGHGNKRVVIARTASERFERLGDRIRLLVLSSLSEAVLENDALLDTYFNITAQKDSEATAKLSRNATLLSRLGVLFLPVSLMTAYFSVQIEDLQGAYTAKEYWVAFAIIMSLSIVCLFFISRLLMTITESLDARVKSFSNWCAQRWPGSTTDDDVPDEDDVGEKL